MKSAGPAKVAGRLKKTARKVKAKTVKAAADHPLVAEIVAAALVGAAAALKNPAKARQLAQSAADEITAAGKTANTKSAALWLLALDIARRSVNSMVSEGGKPPKAPKPPKVPKPPKPPKKPKKKKKKGA